MYPNRKTKSGGPWNHHLDSYLGAIATISIAITIYRTLSRKAVTRTLMDDEVAAPSFIERITHRTLGTTKHESDGCTQTCTNTQKFTTNVCNSKNSHGKDKLFWVRMLIQLWMRYVKKCKKNTCLSPIRSVTFRGELLASCHCSSIVILLQVIPGATAVSTIHQDRCGKYRHPYLTVAPEYFHLKQGDEFLSLYYDNPQRSRQVSSTTITAYGFCKKCGVHLFRAYEDKGLDINFYCIDFSPLGDHIDDIFYPIENASQNYSMSIENYSTHSEEMNHHGFERDFLDNEYDDYGCKLDTQSDDVCPCKGTPSTLISSCVDSQQVTVIPMDLALSSPSSSSIDDPSVYTMSSHLSRLDYHCNSVDYEQDFTNPPTLHSYLSRGIGDTSMKENIPKIKSLFPTNNSSMINTASSNQNSIHQMKKYIGKYLSK